MGSSARYCCTALLCFLTVFACGLSLRAEEADKPMVQAVLNQWGRGINQKNVALVMATYDASFATDGLDFARKQQEFQQQFDASLSLSIEIFNPEIIFDQEQATIRFVQLTHTEQLSDIGRKSMALIKKEGQWKIQSESFEAIVGYLRLSPDNKIDLSLTDLQGNPNNTKNESDGFSAGSGEYNLSIRGIKYQLVKKGVESVCIEGDRQFTPSVQGVEGENPRIVVDLYSVAEFQGPVQTLFKTDLIRSLRIRHDSQGQVLRLVLGIAPGGNYTVEPVYYEMLNSFCVAVKAPGEPALIRTDKPKPTITIEKPE